MTDELVPMCKDGEVLHVHSSCVQAHAQVGWKVLPAEAAEPDGPVEAETGKPSAPKRTKPSAPKP